MGHAILVLNAGSSSIKFALFEQGGDIPRQPVMLGQIDGLGAKPFIKIKDQSGQTLENTHLSLGDLSEQHHKAALSYLVNWLHQHEEGWSIAAVGHRVVHGGQTYAAPARLDPQTIEALRALTPLAPLHQPHNLAGVDAITAALPDIPQVACFDTAFHRSQPALAQLFALPRKYTAEGVRRYGFHGSSYEYIAHILPEHLGDRADGKVIVAHLGNGASMCAMAQRRSLATTMGFTAVDGLMMGTRTGAIDPGVLLYLMDYHRLNAAELTQLLYKESGLLGVSGVSQDMRELLTSDLPEAKEAVDLFCYRIQREIGSLAAALDGVDVLVFTGGIGEHAAAIRAQICRASGWLGLTLDENANTADAARISAPDSRVEVLVLPTNEEWMIARHTARVIAGE